MIFKRKSKTLEEAPLYYWEEKSFMMVIPSKEDENLLKSALKGLEASDEFEIKQQNYKIEENTLYIDLEYKDEEYEVGFFVGGVSVPEFYLNGIQFTESEKEILLKASKAITIFMKFNNNPKKCYQLQLKLAVVMIPDLIGVLDESAERLLSSSWVKMKASSSVLPSSKDLFSVQAIASNDGKVWLHTHGLCRCGFTELEILESDKLKQQNHYNLLNTYAMYLLDKSERFDPCLNGTYIGRLINGEAVVVTCVPWVTGILEYENLSIGGVLDRKNGHNSKTSILFLYKSEEDEKNRVLSKISINDDLWGDNPIFFFSDEETGRMKALARERFNYVKKAFKNKDNNILIKIGLPLKEKGNFEHIWFELLEIKDNKFKARLTQEPYYFDDIHKGYENWYTVDDITDWIVYTPDFSVNPDSAFLLERE